MWSPLAGVTIAVAFLFSAAHTQWVQCGTQYGSPTLRNCHAALEAIRAVPNPMATFLLGPRHGPHEPDIYLPFSLQVGESSPSCAPGYPSSVIQPPHFKPQSTDADSRLYHSVQRDRLRHHELGRTNNDGHFCYLWNTSHTGMCGKPRYRWNSQV